MRTRQVRAVSEIEVFMSQHWSTMVTVYIIGAAVTFVLTFVIFGCLKGSPKKRSGKKSCFRNTTRNRKRNRTESWSN